MIRSAALPFALDRFGATLWNSQLGKTSILPATGLRLTLVQQLRGRLAPGMYLTAFIKLWVRGSMNSIRPEFLGAWT